jgi:uncharacterized protein (DUF2141 family)
MMKATIKKAVLLFLSGFAGMTLHAQTLTVKVHQIRPVSGNLMVGVFNTERGFPDDYYRGIKVQIVDTVMAVTFTGLPGGKYAVSVYQDLNKNGQLDKNMLGIPKEKYGFSNKDNKPDYKKSVFDLTRDVTVNITLK